MIQYDEAREWREEHERAARAENAHYKLADRVLRDHEEHDHGSARWCGREACRLASDTVRR
jgi:hypothetical protein